jgi:hypothetical protein
MTCIWLRDMASNESDVARLYLRGSSREGSLTVSRKSCFTFLKPRMLQVVTTEFERSELRPGE